MMQLRNKMGLLISPHKAQNLDCRQVVLSIYYNFGTGANNTFYEADTVIEFSIQCVYADIPVQASLVTADKTEGNFIPGKLRAMR